MSNSSPLINVIETRQGPTHGHESGVPRPLSPWELLFPELRTMPADELKRIGIAKPTLMIAMTARTGSSHLCSGLASVIRTAKPRELFNTRNNKTPDQKRRGATTMGDYLAQYAAASEDCVVFKTCWQDFEYFQDKIHLLFPNLTIMYLDRFDIEAQAVSLYRAILSGYWHDAPDFPRKLENDVRPEQFDFAKVCEWINALRREKWMWEDYFFWHDVHPYRIYYEHFANDLREVIQRIVRYLNLSPSSLEAIASSFKPVSDDVNQEWLLKMRMYRSGIVTPD